MVSKRRRRCLPLHLSAVMHVDSGAIHALECGGGAERAAYTNWCVQGQNTASLMHNLPVPVAPRHCCCTRFTDEQHRPQQCGPTQAPLKPPPGGSGATQMCAVPCAACHPWQTHLSVGSVELASCPPRAHDSHCARASNATIDRPMHSRS